MQQCRPEMMPLRFPCHLRWAILEPIRKSHVTVCKVECIVTSSLGGCGVILSKYKTHNLAELDIIEEELHVCGILLVLCRSIRFIVEEVLGYNHLHVRVFDVYATRASECNSNRSISGKQRPPYPFPKAFVCSTELGTFDATKSQRVHRGVRTSNSPPMHA